MLVFYMKWKRVKRIFHQEFIRQEKFFVLANVYAWDHENKKRFSLLFSCTNFNQIHRMVNLMHTRSHKVRIHPLKNSLCGNFVISFLLNHDGTFQINLPFMVQCVFSLSKMTLASGQMGASKTFPWPKAVSGLSVENSWLHFVFEWVLTLGKIIPRIIIE